jgi:hypothetical protein
MVRTDLAAGLRLRSGAAGLVEAEGVPEGGRWVVAVCVGERALDAFEGPAEDERPAINVRGRGRSIAAEAR